MFASIPLLCSLLCVAVNGASDVLRIHNASEFFAFINSASTYSGTIVRLESDIDFSEFPLKEVAPKESFSGTFDGQGHKISNLVIRSSSCYAGLFEEIISGRARNFVVDSSCSVTSNFTGSCNARIGGIAGFYSVQVGSTGLIENIVNMANVTFEGNNSGDAGQLYMGGIVGNLYSYKRETLVRNCANYGTIIHSGAVSHASEIGGLIGDFYENSVSGVHLFIQNCINYGKIIVTGSSSSFYVGGLVGSVTNTELQNGVSVCEIAACKGNQYLYGPISKGVLGNCFAKTYSVCYEEIGAAMSSIPNASRLELNQTEVNSLNEYSASNSLSRWILNDGYKSVTFKPYKEGGFILSSQLISLPNFTNGWRKFSGWFTDSSLENPFTSNEITGSMTLYGKWDRYIVMFDINGGDSLSQDSNNVTCNETYGDLPSPMKKGYSFDGWFTERNGGTKVGPDTKITSDHTIYAHWSPASYAVHFDLANGTVLERFFKHKEEVVYPENIAREGFTFKGWNSSLDIMPDHNVTIAASWTRNQYTITFDLQGSVSEKTLYFGSTIAYPTKVWREGHTLSGWVPYFDTMPSYSVTVVAQWSINYYYVILDVNGGDPLPESELALIFNSTYEGLPKPTKPGHKFVGWFTKVNYGDQVTNEMSILFLRNHTLYANWKPFVEAYVTVTFSKNITEGEIEETLKQYTDADFYVTRTEKDESGATKAVVKIMDGEKVEELIEAIKTSSDRTMKVVKGIDIVHTGSGSLSLMLSPIALFNLLLF